LKKYMLKGTPAVPAPEEAASAAAAASAASAEALAAAELAASMAQEAARVASQAQEVASAASAAASEAVAPVASAAVEPVKAASSDSTTKAKAEKEVKADQSANKGKTEANSDDAWVDQLTPNAYVVQLAAMDTQEEMRSFQKSNAVYAKARILRAKHKDTGKRYYILVAGPFENKSQADAFMQSSPLLSKGWLRSSKSMKSQFTKP
jgi:septal ring-binding cell division protein DamX